jgi:putative DNA primase/helicase
MSHSQTAVTTANKIEPAAPAPKVGKKMKKVKQTTLQKVIAASQKDSNNPYVVLDHEGENGLYVRDGNKYLELSTAIRVLGRSVDESGCNPAVHIEYKDQLENLRECDIPEVLLRNRQKLAHFLIAKGVVLKPEYANTTYIIDYVRHYIGWQVPDTTFIRVTKNGWLEFPNKELCYVKGNKFYKPESCKFEIVRSEGLGAMIEKGGKRKDWKDLTRQLRDDPLAVLSMCAAYASPLLKPLVLPNLMLFFVGKSSTGKTTLLKLVASVFASSQKLVTWEGTENGLEAASNQCHDSPFVIDEVSQATGAQFAKLAYRLTNDSGKQRATVTGEISETNRAKNILISSGEQSPLDLMKKEKIIPNDGQVVRLMTIPVQEPHGVWTTLGKFDNGAAKSKYVLHAIEHTFGISSGRFCEYIVPKLEVIRHDYRTKLDDWKKRIQGNVVVGKDDHLANRALENFALFALAGMLAIEAKAVKWEIQHVFDAVHHGFALWHSNYVAAQPAKEADILSELRLFFQSHRGNKFKPLEDWNQDCSSTVAGFEHTNSKGVAAFLVYPAFFEKELCKGHDLKLVCKALDRQHLLIRGSKGTPTRQIHLPNSDKKNGNFYIISQNILFD